MTFPQHPEGKRPENPSAVGSAASLRRESRELFRHCAERSSHDRSILDHCPVKSLVVSEKLTIDPVLRPILCAVDLKLQTQTSFRIGLPSLIEIFRVS
jgi:hypothetical protein